METNPAGEAKHKDRPLVFFDNLGKVARLSPSK